MMHSDNAVELHDICKSFKVEVRDNESKKSFFSKYPTKTIKNTVFKNFSLDVKKGEILGILGRNGSGKSTLLSIIAQIIEPDSGMVETSGPVMSILQLSMGFNNDMTGRENIYLKAEMYGMSKHSVDQIIESIISFSGIESYIDNPLRTYSSGMISRLAFSIMVFSDIKIMVADEVLSTGDVGFSSKASEAFKQFLKDGKTVLFVSHNLTAIESMCTRVIWIEKGSIVADGKPKYVCSEYQTAMAESYEIISDLAESGVPEAQYKLALMFKDGTNVDQDFDCYLSWLQKSADGGHVPAQVAYADELMSTQIEENCDRALLYYQSAANKGNSTAKMRLSSIIGFESADRNRALLVDSFEQLIKIGNPADISKYASFLLLTAWNNEDRKKSFELFSLAASYGNPDAMIQLANMCLRGIGTKKSKKNYEKWLIKAASLNYPKAVSLLADAYSEGRFVERNDFAAFDYYLKLANWGFPNAQYKVATMYRDGLGTEKDDELSTLWFTRYSNSLVAPYLLYVSSLIGPSDVKINVDPLTMLTMAGDSFNQKAMAKLALHYSKDEANYEKSRFYYEKLGEMFGKTNLELAEMLYSGNIFDKDLDRARAIYDNYRYMGSAKILSRLYSLYSKTDNPGDQEVANRYLKLLAARGNSNAIEKMRSIQFEETTDDDVE